MSEAPKILWYDDQECAAGPVQFSSYEVKYIRADLVTELVEALEKGDYKPYCDCEECKKVRETIKALEEK